MEQTKAAFAALYWGQKVLKQKGYMSLQVITSESMKRIEGSYLSLRSISMLTDEERIHVAKIVTRGYQRHFKEPLLFSVEGNFAIINNPNGYKFSKVAVNSDGILYKPYNVVNGDIYYTPNQYEAHQYLISIGICLSDEAVQKGWAKIVKS